MITSAVYRRASLVWLGNTFAVALALSGCAGFESTAANPITPQSAILSGNVHGGQQPVSNSHIYLYAATSNSNYGAASTSLINTTGPGVATDTNGVGYVTTDANGNFSITGDYTCPSTMAPIYLLAVGGNPGLLPNTINNTAITLMAEIGSCQSINSSTLVDVNEVTTAATVTAMQQFMTDSVHMGTSHNNFTGLSNAAASVANIVDRPSGQARATSLLGNGAVPQAKINSIANMLAPCINSASSTSTQCNSLFTAATPTGGATPSDIISAMLLIAQNPGNNVATLFNLRDANAPFQPMLSSAPNDFTIGVTYTGGGLTSPGDIVIDASGDVWAANCPNCTLGSGTDSVVGFGPQGAVLSGASGFTTNIHLPQGIAIDQENAIWAVNDAHGSSPDQVTRLSPAGATYSGFPITSTNLATPAGIAIDANSNAYVTNSGNSFLAYITNNGSSVTGTSNGGACALQAAQGVAVDPSGNVYVSSTATSQILEYSSNLQPTACYQGIGGLNQPIGVALDHSDNIWTVDNGTNNITEISTSTGQAAAGSPYPGGYQLAVLAIAGDGTVWFANCKAGCPGSGSTQPDNVIHLSATGSYLTSLSGYQDTHFNGVGVAAIDGSGNLWVSNNVGGSLTELLGIAAPVATPLVSGSTYNTLGIRP